MPIRTFSPVTESTDTSISSPIMMLWLDLRVRTSIWVHLPLCRLATPARAPTAGDPSIVTGPGERDPARSRPSRAPRRRRLRTAAVGPAAHRAPFPLVSRTVDAPEIPAPAPEPDPRLGAPGADRRLGRPPAGGDRARHREVQAPERAGQRRGAPRGHHRPGLPRGDRPARRG